MTTTTKKPYQQGDVLITPLSLHRAQNPDLTFPTKDTPGAKLLVAANGRYTLLKSPDTGHEHALEAKRGVTVYTRPVSLRLADGERQAASLFVRVRGQHRPAVTHEEHKTFKLAPGEYIVHGVREYDHFLEESRRAID